MTIKATMPLGYTRSPLKLTRGDLKDRSLLRSTFSCWKAERYIMFAKLPLSMRIRLVLNPSIISMITKESSCGCFTPLASSSENRMSTFAFLIYFRGGNLWTLFTYLCYDFLRDLKDPPFDGPPMIIFISPNVLYGWPNALVSCFSLLSSLGWLDSPFFTNFCSFPFRMSSSICSFKSLQSSM